METGSIRKLTEHISSPVRQKSGDDFPSPLSSSSSDYRENSDPVFLTPVSLLCQPRRYLRGGSEMDLCVPPLNPEPGNPGAPEVGGDPQIEERTAHGASGALTLRGFMGF